ncbi:methylated-DNA--[protein]-cysteine S-methyltransferase [Amycolatopsis sp. CA-230715]|uniref:methylated-DNA--[protein]-cysteine S-methyltransferase n=1 Tax=Amycolatopsis sp. CA-230715 TaxID=2745196 RepID=UPI001C014C89|nr:methylated-DNA--[protein]-cysteine S-methyltransferase [Amycolatopsis sp. CA-230715]QWF79075.1 Methylated-DNA--protein-cysteine methyltransferase [Amycolatopsis sp. CA-230715]
MTEFALFDTAIGHCGVCWGEHGITRVQLPEGSEARTRAKVLRDHPGAAETAPPPEIRRAIDEMTALMDGERLDLLDIEVDEGVVPEFHRRVYEITRAIPPGKTLTYGEIAHRLGMPGSAQAVGQALGANPYPIVVPCHRVLAAGGGNGGFSAPGGVDTKLRMLVIEGAIAEEPTLF